MFKLSYMSVSLQYSSLYLHWVNCCSPGERYKHKESGIANTHKNMTATLSTDEETQIKALLEKMYLKVHQVKAIEDLVKVLPKVKREKKAAKNPKFSFWAEEEVSSDEDEDAEQKGAKSILKLTWFCGTTTVPKGHLSFEGWKFEVEGLKEIYGKRVVIQAMRWSLWSPATDVVWCLGTKLTYNEIMEALKLHFGEVAEKHALFSELFSTI